MKYVKLDTDGFPKAFFGETVRPLPPGCIAVTDAQWNELRDNPGKRRWTGTAVIADSSPTLAIPYGQARRQAILSAWPAADQLEAITEAAMGRPEKLAGLTSDIAAIREQYPRAGTDEEPAP